MNDSVPVLPYAGTSGHGGNGASRDRAYADDSSGVTTMRQTRILTWLNQLGEAGGTWKEASERFGWHAGQSSGALSVLHKEGHVLRLQQRRQRCSVYVLPEYLADRATSPHGSHKKKCCPNCGTVI